MPNWQAVLLDIEGTVTPISFVHEILFPYAREHVNNYLSQHLQQPEVQADIQKLREEQANDAEELRQPPIDSIDTAVTYVNRLIDLDRKSPALKSLQGKIWKAGYEDGSLKSPVYPDVVEAFERWRDVGITINIFSSGSVLAQQLLFAHTDAGDLTRYIDQYFDTSVGKKIDPQSYLAIAANLSFDPSQILFLSDVVAELDAAKAAGIQTRLCIRPGNPPQPASQYQSIASFADIF
ncbi:MAG TPA: acireductone synthase [Pyrinomonadaceae bacterium]|jgi:enolase-phosphatase E1|nr:acireductone synthase [Pyrinomonadaceae bacterium]